MDTVLPRVVCLVAATAFAGCASSSSGDAPTSTPLLSAAPTEVVEGPVAATAVAVGDCLNGIVLGTEEHAELRSVEKVDCRRSHGVEVFEAFILRATDFDTEVETDYPGEAPIVQAADAGCTVRLEARFEDPERYGVLAIWPTRSSWESGDRTVACAIFDPTGEQYREPQLP